MTLGRSRMTTLSLRAGAALSALVTAACFGAGCEERAETSPEEGTAEAARAQEGLSLTLPPVRKQRIQLLKTPTPAANAQVLVEFDVDSPEKQIPFYPYVMGGPKRNPMIFRDDGKGGDERSGDGVFTAQLQVDRKALEARVKEEDKRAGEVKEVPRFNGREVVSIGAPHKLDKAIFDGGVAEFFPFEFFIFNPSAAARSLLVTDPLVVRDPTRVYDPCTDTGDGKGAWSFGHLMTEMANTPVTGVSPSLFVEQWLKLWMANQVENTFSAAARTRAQNLIDDWRAASGGGDLDLAKAPFRLLAIVNRTDLGTMAGSIGGYGASSVAFDGQGEMRFVFGLAIPPSYSFKAYNPIGGAINSGGCLLEPFTAIFEYSILRDTCVDIKNWNDQWRALEGRPFDAAFRDDLQAITDQIVVANAAPGAPNGSALNQLRTNDFALASPWQMREFKVATGTHLLDQVVTTDNAALTHNNRPWTGKWMLDWCSGVSGDGCKQPVPMVFPAAYGAMPPNGLASASDVPSPSFFWNGANPPLNASSNPVHSNKRHNFSMNSCGGCHAGETDTNFVHIDNRTPGGAAAPALLSDFMTGVNVPDPAGSGIVRHFDDLERRQERQDEIDNASCFAAPLFNVDAIQAQILKHLPIPEDPFKGIEQPSIEKAVNVPLESFTMKPLGQVH